MSNKKVIGLDLGTGNSAVAIIETNKAKVIENADGYKTTPSVVYIKGDETKIGAAAKRGMVMNPKNTISFVKRFMGAKWDDPDVQKMLKMVTYDVVDENGNPRPEGEYTLTIKAVPPVEGGEKIPQTISYKILVDHSNPVINRNQTLLFQKDGNVYLNVSATDNDFLSGWEVPLFLVWTRG